MPASYRGPRYTAMDFAMKMLERWHIDRPLLYGLLVISVISTIVLYSRWVGIAHQRVPTAAMRGGRCPQTRRHICRHI